MENIEFFREKSRRVRRELFEKFVALQQGHPGSCFSMTDLAVGLYYGNFVRRDPKDATKLLDKVIISKGHATSTLYPILADLGVLSKDEWNGWGQGSSVLRVFGNIRIPGIDATSGSLGHGLGVAAGYAMSFKRKGTGQRVYCIISEGELYEGSVWETLLFINHHRLDNLFIILDRNELMILGKTEDCVRLQPIKQKMEAFGFKTFECDGHNFQEILSAYEQMLAVGGPTCLIADTVKGKGVKLMEGVAKWHYWNPLSPDEVAQCRTDLR